METAMKSWELENALSLVDPTRDALYNYSAAEQKAIADRKPWKEDPHHFKHVRISAVALLKMVMHARSGGAIEVMGLMQGYIANETFIVTDAFRLPVEGTETRVNAQAEGDEYMVKYLEDCRAMGRMENAVGWYHSHPGYGCWLSGIDVATQHTQQMFSDPFLAIVIDPDRTISAGKVEIGAFRTYPENYTPPDAEVNDGFQVIPTGKIEDFGAHASRYYSLEVSHYKSTLDTKLLEALWNKYWVGTLTASPLLTNRDYGTKQIVDLAAKISKVQRAAQMHSKGGVSRTQKKDVQLQKVSQAARRVEAEERTGLLATAIKESVFVVKPNASVDEEMKV
ncbi:COP9 signalosome complex subunit 5 [Aulographum hederae CBS 113979]|uniref:COP9 signalosome complex subunit 5 n=1 Tax=Aulographum hederae CBS 113979 TaxID=1176131 RepID=A0A6G1GQD7_9PEZI|nr:COP9 signalosome complex subunit 5 [Aulographum hederae CBS 113979]